LRLPLVAQHSVKYRKWAIGSVFFFGNFFVDKHKKVTRLGAKKIFYIRRITLR